MLLLSLRKGCNERLFRHCFGMLDSPLSEVNDDGMHGANASNYVERG
jgi:hypothetical protein